jgi:naphtho-gamma-pyrone polyketide synthase
MNQSNHLYLFGAQSFDFGPGLWTLLLPSRDAVLTSFLERAFYALRAEVGALSQSQRTEFQRFSSLHDLLALRNQKLLHPALEQALDCTYQLGCFIR